MGLNKKELESVRHSRRLMKETESLPIGEGDGDGAEGRVKGYLGEK
jgi:hypothetical protein